MMNQLHLSSFKRILKKWWPLFIIFIIIELRNFAMINVHIHILSLTTSDVDMEALVSVNTPSTRSSTLFPTKTLDVTDVTTEVHVAVNTPPTSSPTLSLTNALDVAVNTPPTRSPTFFPTKALDVAVNTPPTSSPTLFPTKALANKTIIANFMESPIAVNTPPSSAPTMPIAESPSTGTPVTESPLTGTPIAESPLSGTPITEIPVIAPTKKDCFISSYSNDGIGHQMEAKISCLATALILNSREVTQGQWTYVHQPVDELQHGQDPVTMEELFGFSKIMTVFYNPETMELSSREILSWPPHPDDMIEVFNSLCPGNSEPLENIIVFNADNCWDFLYYQNQPLPDEWYTHVAPLLRTTILQGASYVQQDSGGNQQTDRFFLHKTERIPGRCLIVMHIRLGDAGERQMRADWIQAVWQNLLTAQELVNQQNNENNEISSPILSYQLAIHSDGMRETVLDMLQFSNETVVFMEDISLAGSGDDKTKAIVSLYCHDEEHANLMTTVYDVLTADIFITSDSSLSHAGSLLRNVTLHGPTIHPPSSLGDEFREQMGTILGWYFLEKAENGTEMLLWSTSGWNSVDSSFWSNLFEVFLSHSIK